MKAEDFEQIALVDWIQFKPKIKDYLIAIRNEGKRSKIEGHQAKLMGLRPGASDLFLAYPSNGKPGLWIELKVPARNGKPAGKPSSEQLLFLEQMSLVGYATKICYGWHEAANTILEYIGDKKANE